jgi:hypothetical protein
LRLTSLSPLVYSRGQCAPCRPKPLNRYLIHCRVSSCVLACVCVCVCEI